MGISSNILSGATNPDRFQVDLPSTAPGPYFFYVDGTLYLVKQTVDYTDGVLYDMTDPQHPKAGLSMPGAPMGVFRIR